MSTPFLKQKEVLDESINKELWAFFCEAGTGKSYMAIETSEYWYTNFDVDAVIIVCPKTLIYGTWILEEIPKHSTVKYNTWGWNNTFSKSLQNDLRKKTRDKNRLLYIVVNHDALKSHKFQMCYNYVKKYRKKIGWIYDESTAMKARKSDRTEVSTALADDAVFKRIMTGTPITESPLDVFSQTEFLQKGLLGFKTFYGMKTRYCELRYRKFGNRSFEEVIGYRDLDDLYRRLRKFSSFLKLTDCTDMPEQISRRIAVPLTKEQIKHYEEMKAFAMTWIEGHNIDAVNALALSVKLHQIAVGQLKLGENQYASIKNDRLETLKDTMEDLNHQCIVWSVYRNSSMDILDYLGKRIVGLSTNDTPIVRQEKIQSWKKGNYQGLLLSQASAAHGLTLNEALSSIFYSNSHSLEKRLQALRRNWRLGQTKKTNVIDLYSPGTVEVGILEALMWKAEVASIITDKKGFVDYINGILPIRGKEDAALVESNYKYEDYKQEQSIPEVSDEEIIAGLFKQKSL